MLKWMEKLRSFTFINRSTCRSLIQLAFCRASSSHMTKPLEQYWIETTCTERYFGASLLSPRRSVNLNTSHIVQYAPDFKSVIRSLGRGVRNFSQLTNVQSTAGYYSDISIRLVQLDQSIKHFRNKLKDWADFSRKNPKLEELYIRLKPISESSDDHPEQCHWLPQLRILEIAVEDRNYPVAKGNSTCSRSMKTN